MRWPGVAVEQNVCVGTHQSCTGLQWVFNRISRFCSLIFCFKRRLPAWNLQMRSCCHGLPNGKIHWYATCSPGQLSVSSSAVPMWVIVWADGSLDRNTSLELSGRNRGLQALRRPGVSSTASPAAHSDCW